MSLFAIDSTLFRLVNREGANPVFDAVMPFVTEPSNPFLYVPLIALALFAVWRWRGRAAWCILLIAVTVTITDRLNSSVIKEMVARERPCRYMNDVRELRPCGAGKSFPSSHAVNITAAALIVAWFFRRSAPYAFGIAALISYSRVYVGVHYPADVIAGALIGMATAALVIFLWRIAMKRWRGDVKYEI
ncbi:MAG: phosphatase PAP2 family protein [Bacteroidetes bacterium]|nr:phosphatase PAP2 family protein [Bacteroidota bacterium]